MPRLLVPQPEETTRVCQLSSDLYFDNVEQFEFEQYQGVSSVKGRLAAHYDFWESQLKANSYVLDVIKNGYRLPMAEMPPRKFLRNNKSALNHVPFVTDAIDALVLSGSVEQVTDIPYIVNPLTVAQNKGGKLRLVLDLRFVNPYVKLDRVKFDDWQVASQYLILGGFMFGFDFKSGYHHIDVHKNYQKYLGFSWTVQGVTKFYQFTVLPFGLVTAGLIFTKVVRCLVKHWRAQSIRAVVYLDDGLVIEQDYDTAIRHSCMVRRDLINAGFVIQALKSIWVPVQIFTWLGITADLAQGTLNVPEGRVQACFISR